MEEAEFKQHIKNTFNTVAEGYECDAMAFFKKSANLLPMHLELSGSEHVLDVATGTGIAAYSIASALPTGKVTAVDFSEGMLNQAKNKFAKHHHLNVELQQMDMSTLIFADNTFDAANCSFGIFFVEDMQAQLSHIIQKVKPGGKVTCCAFYDTAFLPNVDLFLNRLETYGIEPPNFRWKAIGTEEKFEAFYGESELENIEIHRHDIGYYLKDAEGWWEVVWNAGFRGLLGGLDESQLEQFKINHLAEIQALSTSKGIYLNIEVLFAVGEKKQ